VFVMLQHSVISRIEVDSAGTATSAGAQVGDREARIDSLYRGRVVREAYKDGDGRLLIVQARHPGEGEGSFALVFESDGRRIVRYRAGRVATDPFGECY